MRNKKILVVDDDPDALQGNASAPQCEPLYDTRLAGDAFSAVAQGRRSAPDLILLDLGVPAGGGFMVMERLKIMPALATIPVIIVSARDGLGNQKRALDAARRPFSRNP